jgi:hypothetical protein
MSSILDDRNKLTNGLIMVGAGIAAWKLVIKPAIDKGREDATQADAAKNPNVQQAMALQQAMNPSASGLLKRMDGTDNDAIRNTARGITNFSAVQTAYLSLTGRNLMDDLRDELTTTEYNAFLNQIAQNPKTQSVRNAAGQVQEVPVAGGAPQGTPITGRYVVAQVGMYLRSTPDASYKPGSGGWWGVLIPGGKAVYDTIFSSGTHNIISVVKANDFIGYATGETAFDSKNNVKFLKVAYRVKGTVAQCPVTMRGKNGQVVTAWVAAGSTYVKQYAYAADVLKAQGKYPTAMYWKTPPPGLTSGPLLPTLSGVGVVTAATTAVLNESLQPVDFVAAGTRLGRSTGAGMRTVHGGWQGFRSNAGRERFVSQRDVRKP